jgi:hypothetical protein
MKNKKKDITQEFLMNYWLQKGHGITTAWLIEHEPELIKTPDWFRKYEVSQELHDEWYEWAIDILSKAYHTSKANTKKQFCYLYLNLAPSVIKKNETV